MANIIAALQNLPSYELLVEKETANHRGIFFMAEIVVV